MKDAPSTRTLSLPALFDEYILPNLLSPEAMQRVHDWLKRYSSDPEAVFPVRHVAGSDRRRLYRTIDGTNIAPCDNSPAGVLHAQLLRGNIDGYQTLRTVIPDLPRHFHDLKRHETANRYGWYIAHIIPAKNRDVDFLGWDRKEVVRRFMATLHPCNIFLVPGTKNRRVGEDPDVIAYVAGRYASLYASIWDDFIRSVDVPPGRGTLAPTMRMNALAPDLAKRPDGSIRASYRATRLLFKKSEIEPLEWGDLFEITTPGGTFRLSKRQFYDAFGKVVVSRSYQEIGVYSYSVTPERARAFLFSKKRPRRSPPSRTS